MLTRLNQHTMADQSHWLLHIHWVSFCARTASQRLQQNQKCYYVLTGQRSVGSCAHRHCSRRLCVCVCGDGVLPTKEMSALWGEKSGTHSPKANLLCLVIDFAHGSDYNKSVFGREIRSRARDANYILWCWVYGASLFAQTRYASKLLFWCCD